MFIAGEEGRPSENSDLAVLKDQCNRLFQETHLPSDSEHHKPLHGSIQGQCEEYERLSRTFERSMQNLIEMSGLLR
jgi:hypothetical protein